MRSCRMGLCVSLFGLCVALSACSDGRERHANMLAVTNELSCDAIANPTKSARWADSALERRSVAKSQFLRLAESEHVLRHFKDIGYRFEEMRSEAQPVPRVYLAKMPTDLPELDETNIRKQLFLAALLPAVLRVNEEIRETRRRLTAVSACQQSGHALSEPVQQWVGALAAYYRTRPEAAILLVKVAEIPTSMALAQAAVESGWGTSAPAQTGNSLFGQYMVEEEGSGRNKKSKLRLASFDTLLAAVRSYADNLNIHPAYSEFRERRTQMLHQGLSLDGMKLVETLGAYSKRRANYIRDLQVMIRKNKLDAFDRVDLASRQELALAGN